jgi:hypothetical protein
MLGLLSVEDKKIEGVYLKVLLQICITKADMSE